MGKRGIKLSQIHAPNISNNLKPGHIEYAVSLDSGKEIPRYSDNIPPHIVKKQFGELAGTTVEQQVPVQVESVETFENAYVMISQFYAIRDASTIREDYFLDYKYHVYASKADREADFHNTIYSEFMSGENDTVFNGSQNIAEHCYSKLKALRGFELLTDD